MDFIQSVQNKAAQNPDRKIIFPESTDVRILTAAYTLHQKRLVTPVLLGEQSAIEAAAATHKLDISGIEIVDTARLDTSEYARQYFEMRQHKGMTAEQAREVLKQPLFMTAFLVRDGFAAGAVAGAVHTTGDVLRAAIQVIGLAPDIKVVSSCFEMVLTDGRVFSYGDCAVMPNPTAEQLASIALSTAETHSRLTGELPRVAMLSFSTKGSARHDDVDKVIAATGMVKQLNPGLDVDGELQFDAALMPEIGARKAPGSPVAGKANVFIFPDLDAGNIGYKITERLAGAQAIGPVIQGLAKPFNDLSRGCKAEDVVNVACICSLLS
ncbi:MAG: phosphate acetyltransferase [Calditrichaeota bacterium]|nr:MAG: phosphate acetyltransferase [Calditrichota bacterium]